MRTKLRCCLAAAAAALLLSACASSQSALAPLRVGADRANGAATSNERVIYTFTGALDGGDPATALTFDTAGNLYGTAVVGGSSACGAIFKLAPQSGSSWKESVINSFDCYGGGKNPYGGVTLDAHGNFYGTTVSGGSGGSCGSTGCGTAFALTSTSENVLHSFTGGNDGFGPGGAMVFNGSGDLFGTTPDGGRYAQGVVYELSGHGRSWHEHVIHAFTGGKDGSVGSLGSLLVEASGDLYGVTEEGGAHGAGVAFKLSASSKKKWKLTTLYAFKGSPDAASPYGGLIADASGNLYGTTYYGGAHGMGTVFELVAKKRGGYHERVLYSFKGGGDGGSPTSTLLLSGMMLYGTASAGGGSCGCGTVFAVDARSRKESVLHTFAGGSDGAYPYYGLVADSSGNLYGTTVAGGSASQGTVFEVMP